MKKTLKKWKEDLAAAKAAWVAARKTKKDSAETKAAAKEYEELRMLVDEAEAGGAKDDDEVERTTEKKADSDDSGITIEALKVLLTETVGAAVKAQLPENLQPQVTAESIKSIVESVLAKHAAQGEKVSKADVEKLAGEVAKEQIAQLSKASKMGFQKDANDDQDGFIRIEIPSAHSKGNLPVHMKQLLNIMTKKAMNDGISDAQLKKAEELGARTVFKYQKAAQMVFNMGAKALTSTGTGTGDEWVPTDLSSELQRRFFLASELASIIAAREIDMPSQPYEYPLSTTRPTFYLETTENVEATPSTPGTGKVTLNAKKLMGRVDFSYEVDEDSIIPVLPFIQSQLAEAAADAYESAIINGDTAATHQDSDTQLIAKAAERAFDGLRKLALAVSSLKIDLATGGLNEANLRALKKALKKYGVRMRDLIWVVGPGGRSDMEGITNVTTIDKYGPRATLVTGELANFLGIPIVTSERQREDLNASGVYDGVTTNRGFISLVNISRFIAGRRRAFTVEVDKDIKTQTHFVVASFRRAFQPIETPSASITSVVGGINYVA